MEIIFSGIGEINWIHVLLYIVIQLIVAISLVANPTKAKPVAPKPDYVKVYCYCFDLH